MRLRRTSLFQHQHCIYAYIDVKNQNQLAMEVDNNVDNDNNMEVEEVSYWDSCPAEILLIVFEYLQPKDLLSCMGVNTSWRANAEYLGKKSGKWFRLLQDGAENKAFSFTQRSRLEHRELYLNCRMWYSVSKAQVRLKHVYGVKGIKNMHVYRDNLIVICENSVKFYEIETGRNIKEVLEQCIDYQETDYLVAKFSQREGKTHILLFSKRNNRAYESLGFRLCNVEQNKCHLTNWKNGVDFFECTPTKFLLRRLGRYYSSPRLLCALHMYNEDMYIYTRKGDVYLRKNGELGINRVCSLFVPCPPSPEYTEKDSFKAMFHECSVVYGVTSKEKEKMIKNLDVHGKEHLVLLYMGLTCAVKHDEVLLLGFNDGKVGIVLIKQLWITNDLTPAFQFYIQEVAQTQDVESITHLEVYEADACHHLLVGTANNLYQVVVSHADYEKVMI